MIKQTLQPQNAWRSWYNTRYIALAIQATASVRCESCCVDFIAWKKWQQEKEAETTLKLKTIAEFQTREWSIVATALHLALPFPPHVNIDWADWGYKFQITSAIIDLHNQEFDSFGASIIPATPLESVRTNHGYHRNSMKCRTSPSHVAPPQFPSHKHEKSVSLVRLQVPPLEHGAASQGSSTAWK